MKMRDIAEEIGAPTGASPSVSGRGKPVTIPPQETKRTFSTGATRDTQEDKLDFEGFLSPLVIRRYAGYLNGHRTMKDGSTRDSDNWQKGIPLDVYMESGWRHFFDMWEMHRGWRPGSTLHARMEDAMCAVLFNVSGYLHEWLKRKTIHKLTFDEADLASQESEGLDVNINSGHIIDKGPGMRG